VNISQQYSTHPPIVYTNYTKLHTFLTSEYIFFIYFSSWSAVNSIWNWILWYRMRRISNICWSYWIIVRPICRWVLTYPPIPILAKNTRSQLKVTGKSQIFDTYIVHISWLLYVGDFLIEFNSIRARRHQRKLTTQGAWQPKLRVMKTQHQHEMPFNSHRQLVFPPFPPRRRLAFLFFSSRFAYEYGLHEENGDHLNLWVVELITEV